jgi:kynurenine formamidase
MRLVDLSHPWNTHTPGWVGYPGSKIYHTQTLQTNRIVSQRVETSLHVETHLDGPMHAADGAGDVPISCPSRAHSGALRSIQL